MNNFDRIEMELRTEAEQRAPKLGLQPDEFLELAVHIVDLEDRHRLAQLNINQQVETLLMNAANRGKGN